MISNKEPFPVLLFLLFFLSAFTRGVLSSPQGKSWHRPAASVLPGNDLFYFFVATWRGGGAILPREKRKNDVEYFRTFICIRKISGIPNALPSATFSPAKQASNALARSTASSCGTSAGGRWHSSQSIKTQKKRYPFVPPENGGHHLKTSAFLAPVFYMVNSPRNFLFSPGRIF